MDPGAWTAILFLMLGLVLLVLEVLNPGFFIAVPGGTLAVMGAIGLVAPAWMFGPYAWFTWPAVAILATVANLYFYKRWAPSGKAPLTMAADSLVGQEGEVEVAVQPSDLTGKVRIRGTTWSARGAGAHTVAAGQRVRVVSAEGVHVVVEPVA